MALAFVLIITEIGYKESVLKGIGEVDGVKEAYMSHGVYDIIAVIKYETTKELREKVFRIQKIDKAKSTLTMTAVT